MRTKARSVENIQDAEISQTASTLYTVHVILADLNIFPPFVGIHFPHRPTSTVECTTSGYMRMRTFPIAK